MKQENAAGKAQLSVSTCRVSMDDVKKTAVLSGDRFKEKDHIAFVSE